MAAIVAMRFSVRGFGRAPFFRGVVCCHVLKIAWIYPFAYAAGPRLCPLLLKEGGPRRGSGDLTSTAVRRTIQICLSFCAVSLDGTALSSKQVRKNRLRRRMKDKSPLSLFSQKRAPAGRETTRCMNYLEGICLGEV